jgi:hypothetical protein
MWAVGVVDVVTATACVLGGLAMRSQKRLEVPFCASGCNTYNQAHGKLAGLTTDQNGVPTTPLCVSAGAAFVADQLLSVGADGNICIWGLTAPTSRIAAGNSMLLERTPPAAAAASRDRDGADGQQHQQHLLPMQEQQQAQGVSSLRSWLEPRRLAGSAVAVAGGVAVSHQQPMLVDEGKMHSSWHSRTPPIDSRTLPSTFSHLVNLTARVQAMLACNARSIKCGEFHPAVKVSTCNTPPPAWRVASTPCRVSLFLQPAAYTLLP